METNLTGVDTLCLLSVWCPSLAAQLCFHGVGENHYEVQLASQVWCTWGCGPHVVNGSKRTIRLMEYPHFQMGWTWMKYVFWIISHLLSEMHIQGWHWGWYVDDLTSRGRAEWIRVIIPLYKLMMTYMYFDFVEVRNIQPLFCMAKTTLCIDIPWYFSPPRSNWISMPRLWFKKG